MKNTKMKYKIFFVMMLLLTLLNNTSAYDVNEGEIASYDYTQLSHSHSNVYFGGAYEVDGFYVMEGAEGEGLTSISSTTSAEYWEGSTNPYGKGDVIYKYNGAEVGTGYMYFWQSDIDEDPEFDIIYIKAYFDNGLIGVPSGKHTIEIDGAITTAIKFSARAGINLVDLSYEDKYAHFMFTYEHDPSFLRPLGYTCDAKSVSGFYNKYYYWYNEQDELFEFNITRDIGNKSKMIFHNNDVELINETSLQSTSITVVSDDIDNSTWHCTFIDKNSITHEKTLNFIPIDKDITPTLTTDKSLYNTSELLTISYTNIDEMNIHGTPALFIVYPIIDDYHDYDAKFMQHLLSSKEDETFTINTSILQPQTEYYLVIADNTDWSRIESAYITSDVFYVYPDEEYLTTSCTPEGNCYGGNGGYLSIYYKINNNSDIIIKDDEGSIIQTYYNIINEGEINYHVPFDENKLNSYPNWKIYLNNTEYSTSYNTDVIIYWSLFVTPTPTPVYTVDIPDENVSEMVDDLKKESKPIFDLIYGLTTLVIDNPDYDNDNIIDEHEINNWFNSLIPLGILLLLVILYMGLKKRD